MEAQLKEALEAVFRFHIHKASRVGGGDSASAFRLETSRGALFAKIMPGPQGADILRAEAEGLRAISSTNTLRTPEVLGLEPLDEGACLLLEFVPTGPGAPQAHEALGRGLAQLHSLPAPHFGWAGPNYIGPLPQRNTPETDWATFYARHRLEPQYAMAARGGWLQPADIPDTGRILEHIAPMMPEIKPSLLHGDLWGGNYLISEQGTPLLIDPAAYYGHAEVDLAMSLLFGGFPQRFYDAYDEIVPREDGFAERVALYQLYYLLVHLNLFGPSYSGAVTAAGSRLFGL